MSAGFHILIHRSDECAHFRLIGDFDDKAAVDLIAAFRDHCDKVSKIFIHTDSLDKVADYDKQELNKVLNDGSNSNTAKILSTGRFREIFTPFKCPCF